MNDKITWDKPTADALAVVLAKLRPDWQMPGIMTALADQRLREREASAVVLAAVRACRDPKVRTPAVIAMDGQHWHEPDQPAPTLVPLPYKPDRSARTDDEIERANLAAAAARAVLGQVKGTVWCPDCKQSMPRNEVAAHDCGRENAVSAAK